LDVGFGVLDEYFNFCGQERINNSLKTFMEHELEKVNDQRREKIDLFQVGVRKIISIIQNQVVMSCNLFIFLFQVILVLGSTGWIESIKHPKDHSGSLLRSSTYVSIYHGTHPI